VAAIKLAGRDEVERGDEHADPTGDEDGVWDDEGEVGKRAVGCGAEDGMDCGDGKGSLDVVDSGGGRVAGPG